MDKAFVSPFLFDIKRSEVDGPILQFQSTIFEEEDLKKLVTTLNKACDKDGLTTERLNKAFEVWYPTLKADLEKLRNIDPSERDADGTAELETPKAQEILEEILELSRINQKLIRNPDGALGSNLEEMSNLLRALLERAERFDDPRNIRRMRKLHPKILDEIIRMSISEDNDYVGVQMVFGLLKSQYPWIYDAGIETINILRSGQGIEEKHHALQQLRRVMDFTIEHPMMRDIVGDGEDMHYLSSRLQNILIETFERKLRAGSGMT